jgi:hypothetical protein
MSGSIILFIASGITALWGIAHLFATGGVVRGFGDLSTDNRRIITMEWIVEGVALLAIGAFVAVAAAIAPASTVSAGVYLVAITSLIVLSIVSLFTGFRIAFLPFRLCPVIFGVSAVLIVAGMLLSN